MRAQPVVSVIVPTLATSERAPFLQRALASVHAQRCVRAVPIVVVNGPGTDEELLSHLRRRRDIRLVQLEQADLSAALAAGRAHVDTASFADLDDDDLLVPESLATRLEKLFGADDPDAVVSDGIVHSPQGEGRCIDDTAAVRRDPLRFLMRRNWLLPGAVLFNTERIAPSTFSALPRYLERTYLAAVLALRFRLCFIETATVVHFIGNPFSIDATRSCRIGRADAIRRLLELPLPSDVRRNVRHKIGAAEHDACAFYLAEGSYRAAWAAHLRSLATAGGSRYLAYTRYLLRYKNRPQVDVAPLAHGSLPWP